MKNVKVGDIVTRHMAGMTMPLKVTKVTSTVVECGDWTFDLATGEEIDNELGWGPAYGHTGSYIVNPEDGE